MNPQFQRAKCAERSVIADGFKCHALLSKYIILLCEFFRRFGNDHSFLQYHSFFTRSKNTFKIFIKPIFHSRTGHEDRLEIYLYSLYKIGPSWRWIVNATHRPLYLRDWRGSHCIRNWVEPRAALEGADNSPLLEFDFRTIHHIASRHDIFFLRTFP